MKEVEEYIEGMLAQHGIRTGVGAVVEELAVSNRINEFMSPQSIYSVFLLHLAKDDEMFKAILNGEHVFDMEVTVPDKGPRWTCAELKRRVVSIYGDRIRYAYVGAVGDKYLIGIKLGAKAYEPVAGYGGPESTIPYFLLADGLKDGFRASDFGWSEIVFEPRASEDEHSKYVEIVEHLKRLRLPVSIIDDDAMHIGTCVTNVHECYLHCGSHENWPEDADALRCAKTALYCLIHKKSRYRSTVGYDYVLLRYRGSHFRFRIVIKRDKNAEFRINLRICEVVARQSDVFRKNVVVAKRFLESHGYLPVYFDDRLVELICLMVGRGIDSFGKFFSEFLDHRIRLEGLSLNLETLKAVENKSGRFEVVYQHDMVVVGMPPQKVVHRLNALKKAVRAQSLQLFDRSFRLQTHLLLQPSFKDYDFVLSLSPRPGFVEAEDKAEAVFVLGAPSASELLTPALRSKGYFFYSPGHGVLMVKAKAEEGVRAEEMLYVLLLKTGFRYFLRNF